MRDASNGFGNFVCELREPSAGVYCGRVMPRSSETLPATETETELKLDGVWRVVVLNDPVNLMSYVVLVFKKVFGFDEQTARKKMLEVHEQGRSIVWSGLREKAEAYVFTLQQWHLTAVLEPDEAN
ncbi:MAG: ATP-dependent Clp protease adaptor ClpS [Opitutaceae bacterium]|nr:ATP-dependent Clp protease adaptor ClpS [Opitutaceae bacterium]